MVCENIYSKSMGVESIFIRNEKRNCIINGDKQGNPGTVHIGVEKWFNFTKTVSISLYIDKTVLISQRRNF
jgi:hypothetical protein